MKKYRTIAILLVLVFIAFANVSVYAEDSYIYDDNGRVIEVIHDDGTKTKYTYDKNGNLINVSTVEVVDNLSDDTEEPASESGTEEPTSETNREKTSTRDETSEETSDVKYETTTEMSSDHKKEDGTFNDDKSKGNVDTKKNDKKTDDNTHLGLLIAVFVISLIICLCLIVKKIRCDEVKHQQ